MYDISKTEVKIKVAKVDEDDCDLDAIWKDLDTSFKKSLPFIEDTVSKWSNVNYNHLLQKEKGRNGKKGSNGGVMEQV